MLQPTILKELHNWFDLTAPRVGARARARARAMRQPVILDWINQGPRLSSSLALDCIQHRQTSEPVQHLCSGAGYMSRGWYRSLSLWGSAPSYTNIQLKLYLTLMFSIISWFWLQKWYPNESEYKGKAEDLGKRPQQKWISVCFFVFSIVSYSFALMVP